MSFKEKKNCYLRPLLQTVLNTYCGFHGQIVVALQCCVFIWVIALVILIVPFVASVCCRVSGRTDPWEQDREVDQAVEQTKDHHQEKDLPRQGEITSLRKINAKKGEISMQKKIRSVRKKPVARNVKRMIFCTVRTIHELSQRKLVIKWLRKWRNSTALEKFTKNNIYEGNKLIRKIYTKWKN